MALSSAKPGATHVQQMANAVWTFKHDLGRDVCVDVFVDFQGRVEKILPRNIINLDPNTLRIEFSKPMTGRARAV